MEVYAVGGSVRDELLGLKPNDHDFVVVGATHEDLVKRGFSKVGADFPVYLHPTSGDQWALARKERKTGPGYHGFEVNAEPTVTIEEDLSRRDLTINSMARHSKTGELVDPFGGQHDLAQGVLRHTSRAFGEDPLRVLRLARFAAKFPDFKIAQDTVKLCAGMISEGALDELSQERVWAELTKALTTPQPFKFFEALYSFKAFGRVKGLKPFGTPDLVQVRKLLSKTVEADLVIAWLASHGTGKLTEEQARGVPAGTRLAFDVLKLDWRNLHPASVFQRLQSVGAFRHQWPHVERVLNIMDRVDVPAHKAAVDAATGVATDQFLHLEGAEIGRALMHARINAVRVSLGEAPYAQG